MKQNQLEVGPGNVEFKKKMRLENKQNWNTLRGRGKKNTGLASSGNIARGKTPDPAVLAPYDIQHIAEEGHHRISMFLWLELCSDCPTLFLGFYHWTLCVMLMMFIVQFHKQTPLWFYIN